MSVLIGCFAVDKTGVPTFEAFGEFKTLADWQRDPRCLVDRKTLYRRVFKGWTLAESLSVPPGQQPRSLPTTGQALKAA